VTDLHVRHVPPELAKRYVDQGWWTSDTLGELLARASQTIRTSFSSAFRPAAFRRHVGDVELLARRLAAGLRARGVGPGMWWLSTSELG